MNLLDTTLTLAVAKATEVSAITSALTEPSPPAVLA